MRPNDYIYGGLGGIQNLKLEPVYEGSTTSEDEDEVSDEVLNPKAYKLTWDPVEGANSYVIYRAQISLDKKSAEELEEIPFALEENLDVGLEKYADKSAKGAVFLEIGMTPETVYVDKNLEDGKDYYYCIKGYKANTKRGSTATQTSNSASSRMSKLLQDEFDDIEYGIKWYNRKKQYEKFERVLFDTNTEAAKKIDNAINDFVIFKRDELKIINGKEWWEKPNFACAIIDQKPSLITTSTSIIYFAHSSVSYLAQLAQYPILKNYVLKPTEAHLLKAKLLAGQKTIRDSDTEYKILCKIMDDKILPKNMILFTELDPCDSCKHVIMQFCHYNKNTKLNIIYKVVKDKK